MWYWDHIPSGWQHHKKPLTKWQIKKLQEAYANAGAITESVKSLEKKEQIEIKEQIEKELNILF